MSARVKRTAGADETTVELERLLNERPLSALQIRVVALCALAALIDGYDIQAMPLSVPRLAAHFALPAASFAPAVVASLVGMAVGAMLFGPLADRWGRRPLLIGSMLLIGVASLAATFSGGVAQLAFWRLLTGLGLGGALPAGMALIAEYAPARRRAALITAMVCAIAIGNIVAAVIAPLLQERWGWQGIFALGGLAPLLAAALFWFALPESVTLLVARRPDQPKTLAVLAKLAPSVEPSRIRLAPRAKLESGKFAALLTRSFRGRTALLSGIFFSNLFVNFAVISWLPALLRSAGWAEADALRGGSLVSFGGLVGGLSLSWIADRGRPIPTLATGYVGAAIALGLFLALPPSGAVWGALLFLVGVFAFGTQMTIGALMVSYYPPEIRATGVGWVSAIGRAGSFIGPSAVAVLMHQQTPTGVLLGLLCLPMLICALAVFLIPNVLKSDAASDLGGAGEGNVQGVA